MSLIDAQETPAMTRLGCTSNHISPEERDEQNERIIKGAFTIRAG